MERIRPRDPLSAFATLSIIITIELSLRRPLPPPSSLLLSRLKPYHWCITHIASISLARVVKTTARVTPHRPHRSPSLGTTYRRSQILLLRTFFYLATRLGMTTYLYLSSSPSGQEKYVCHAIIDLLYLLPFVCHRPQVARYAVKNLFFLSPSCAFALPWEREPVSDLEPLRTHSEHRLTTTFATAFALCSTRNRRTWR